MDYFEDIAVGDEVTAGSYEVTAEEIVSFAEQYDPQPFHLDPEAAEASPFGGLVASGWHTAAMTMRLLVDDVISEMASQGAKGVDELRWHRPVRPDDTLSVRAEIDDKEVRNEQSGLLRVRITTAADGERVMSMVGLVLCGRRGEK